LYSITLNLKVSEDAVTYIDKDFTQVYRTGDSIANFAARFEEQMQKEIDDYQEEQNIYTHAALDNILVDIKNNLEW
jgi:hypothetical protein